MTFFKKCQHGLINVGVVPLIHLYRMVVSPMLGARCRFVPSCSEYAEEALHRHGLFRGWHSGGYLSAIPCIPVVKTRCRKDNLLGHHAHC